MSIYLSLLSQSKFLSLLVLAILKAAKLASKHFNKKNKTVPPLHIRYYNELQ